ncbi:MAG: PH domain-containing protein [Planctomycetota bacterium]|jgi:hypothetical protein
MEFTENLDESQTKACLFCAEIIQAKAVKCRFCGEFLNTDKAKALANTDSESPGQTEKTDTALLRTRPSLWCLTGTILRAMMFIAVAAALIAYPLEDMASRFEQLPDSISQEGLAEAMSFYRKLIGAGLAIIAVLILAIKIAWLKSIEYEVTADRIEFSRGLFDRKIDNIDMFRVIDLNLRRNMFDCIVGIGAVTLITTDKTDSTFTFKKTRKHRQLYDIIKKVSLEADKKNSVIHLE